MSDYEEDEVAVVEKKQKKEKRPKKKAEDDGSDASEAEKTDKKKNKKKRKREEVQLTEEEKAAAKAERSRKKWKKRDAKVRDCRRASASKKSEFCPSVVPFGMTSNDCFVLFAVLYDRLQPSQRHRELTRQITRFNSARPRFNKNTCGRPCRP